MHHNKGNYGRGAYPHRGIDLAKSAFRRPLLGPIISQRSVGKSTERPADLRPLGTTGLEAQQLSESGSKSGAIRSHDEADREQRDSSSPTTDRAERSTYSARWRSATFVQDNDVAGQLARRWRRCHRIRPTLKAFN